jgi:CDP-diacylglycerol---serine O-phosphatidyltransferase
MVYDRAVEEPAAARRPRPRPRPRPRRRRFTMLREFTLADVITLSNGFAGTGSIFASLQFLVTGERAALWLAFGLLPFAMLFDYLDGQVARWRRKVSLLGAQLDSLADLVSFGVAPAVLAFAVGMRGFFDVVVLVYFVSCGISRLARYNATAAALSDDTGKVKYFEGTPIPTSMLLVAVLAFLFWRERTGDALPLGTLELLSWEFHPLVMLYAISGSAMISKTLRIPKI